ncbi:MAG: hypothetical protein AAB731_05225 [Patescibacteria group bacterium]
MPVYIYDKDAFRKMMLVEGGGSRKNELDFVRYQCTFTSEWECSFFAFYQKWQEEYARNPKLAEEEFEYDISVNGNCAIYGLSGWNRYSVRNTGEIFFLRHFVRYRDIWSLKKATELGFTILPKTPDP